MNLQFIIHLFLKQAPMSTSTIDRDVSTVASARHIGTAILYISTDGIWSVGQKGQKVSEYQTLKFGGNSAINDDTFEFTALTAELRDEGGYVLYLQSNANTDAFVEVYADLQGNITGGKPLSQAEFYAAEVKWGVDLNENGGLGDAMVLVDAGQINMYVDGMGAFQMKQANGTFVPLKFAGAAVTQKQLAGLGFEVESVVADAGGYKIFVRDDSGNVIELGSEDGGDVNPTQIRALNSAQLATAEASSGEDLNGRGDAAASAGWTSALKTAAVKTEVDTLTANGAKIDHAGLVKIVNAAIQSAGSGTTIGADLFNDLKAIAARAANLFTAKDLAGAESGYLQYVFDKLVNGSKANSFYTGGNTQAQALGNLSADSTPDALQKLQNKWLLGKDLPNPNTEGDTANPNATAASGVYKAFNAELIAGGTQAFDVSQGSAGTCYLLAGIATVAHVNPTAFNAMFASNGNGTDGAPTWGVRFFDTKGQAHWVTVNNQLAVRGAEDTQAAYTKVKGVDASGNTVEEMWAPLVEKAYAQANEIQIFGRTKETNAMFAIEGGFAEGIVNVAGGKVTQYGESAYIVNGNPILQVSTVPDGSTALAEYTKALNAGKPFFVVSFAKTQDSAGASQFVSGHAYMAMDADLTSSTNTSVKVYNPWGFSARTDGNPSPTFVSPFDGDLVTLAGTTGISFWVGV